MKALRLPAGRRLSRFVAIIASALAAVTCDLITGPNADSGLTVEFTGPAVLTVGRTVAFGFRVLEHGVPVEGARVRVVSSAPDIVAIQGDEFTPRLFVKARGQATITATLLGSTLGENPPFVAAPITGVVQAVAIDSASVTFRSLGDTLRLRAEARDFNDQLIAGAGASARWSTTNAAIVQADSISGRIAARGNGTAQVIARLDSTADTTTVLVQQRLVRFAFAPVNLVLNALSLDTVVTVTPLDSGGAPLADGAPAFTTTMTALNAGIASVVRLTNTTFRVTSQGNSNTATGVRVVDAVGNVADDTLSVAVGQIAQTMVITSALSDTIDAFQDTLRVRARAFDARNVEVQSRAISWTSANTSVVTVDETGLVTGQTAASVQVQAKMDAATAAAAILVRNTPRSVSLSLDSTRITTIGDTVVVGAMARNRLGATVAGASVTWQSLDSTIAQVTAGGAVIATGVGTTRVIASIAGGYADTLRVRVTNDPTAVDIIPPTLTLASIGDTAIPNVDIRNSRGANLGRTTVFWRSADTIVTVTATGVIVARADGSTFVTATTPDSARADTVVVTVTNAPETVTLNRVLDTLTAPTRTLQYDAVVRNSRGAIVSGTTVNWHSSNASAASVNAAGLVTALAVGQTFVIGEATGAAGLRADSARLVVTNDVMSVTVSPTNLTVPSVGATATISADPRNAVGASVSGVSVLWSTSDANVATVDATGTVTGVAVGTATITGDVAGKTASAAVTVTNAPDTISILPASVTLASVNDSLTPPVAFRNALGTPLPRSAAQWSSLDGAIAQVTPDGIIIATGRGTTQVGAINALNPARRDSITVTVTNAPDSIDVGRTLDLLPSLNRTIQYSADVFNARRDPIVGQAVSWTSRTASVATVTPTGLATSVGIGGTWIVGTAGTRSDSAQLVVSNRSNSVVLTPASLALTSIGATATLAAVARNELGNVIAAPTVTWSSANSGVAGVSGTGVVTAVATGSTTVSATVDGVTASATVSVSNPPTTLAITTPSPLTLASIGDVFTLVADIRNGLNVALPNSAALWTSGNANICTVSGSGVVTATGAGTCTVTATSPANGALTSSITVNVTDAPATLTIAPAGTTTLPALGAGVTLVATVRNAAGAVIASPVPAVTWASGSAAVTVTASTGVATAVAPTAGATITATAGVATATVTVAVVPVASATRSTIASSAASITATGASTATITVQLKDGNGNNVTTSGGSVTMSLTGTGTLGAVTNHNDGTYTATLTAPTALGSGSVSASIGSATITNGDPLVTYVAGAATRYLVTSSGTSAVAGTAVTISAQLADAFNNPVTTARTVMWSSSGGGAFGAATSATNPSGIATVSFTTSTTAATTHTVTATDNVAVAGTSGPIQTIAGAATNYLVTTSASGPAAGSGVTVTAQLRDASANAASEPGQVVTWTKSDATGAFSSPTSTTNGNGVATVTLTTHTVSGTSTTVTATTGSVTGTSGTVTTVPGAASATTTTISASPTTVNSGGTSAITVTARDGSGNSLTASGGVVTLSASGGSIGTVTDNNNGTYTATFTASTSGSVTISGTINGAAITSTASITVNVGAVSAAQSVATVPAGTAGSVTTVTIQARDAAGNNLTTNPGVVAQVTITGANPAVAATATNNGNGTYTFTYTPTVSGTDAFTVTLGGTAILGSPYLSVVNAGSVSTFLVEAAGGGAIATQTAGTAFNVRISARDAGNNVVPSFTGAGNTVDLTSSGTLTGTSVTTGTFTNGVLASQAVTITTTGTFTITATRSVGGTSASFGVVAGAASAAHTTATVPAGQAGQVTTIAVQARDALGNDRTTSSGTVTVAVSGANTATASVVNNNDGTYTATYTPTVMGTDNVAILLGGTQIHDHLYTSAVNAGGLHHFAVTAAGGGAIGTPTAGASFFITITAQDVGNNTVASFDGGANTVNISSTSAILVGGGTTAAFVAGILGVPITLATAGTGQTITATRTSGGTQAGTSNSFTVSVGALHHFLVEESGGGAISAQTAGTSFNIRITAVDANDNTVTTFSGGGHKAVITSTTGTLTGTPITTANFSSGVLASQAVTITNTGSFTLTATRSGGSEAGTSADFAVGAGAASAAHSTATVPAGTAGQITTITVQAKDALGNNRTSTSGVVVVSVTGANAATPTVSDNGSGTYTATYTPTLPGTDNVAITLGGTPISGSPYSSTVSIGALHHFAITAIETQTTGTSFPITITAQDVSNNTVTSYSGAGNTVDISLDIVTGTGSLTVGGGATATFASGVLATHAVTITVTTAATFQLRATRTSGGAQFGTSNTFQVNP